MKQNVNADTYDEQTAFHSTKDLPRTIDQTLQDPDARIIQIQHKDDKKSLLLLRGLNPTSNKHFKLFCARHKQIELVAQKYKNFVLWFTEAMGRLDRATSYGLTLTKITSDEEIRKLTPKQEEFDYYKTMDIWTDDTYVAILDKNCRMGTHHKFNGHPLWHLHVRRRDQEPMHDWRILQGIKNIVVGREYEAIELYPADSRIMDVGNVYHLWILGTEEEKTEATPPRFPIGAKNPDKGGAISNAVLLVTERSLQHQECTEALNKAVEYGDIYIFPDELLPAAVLEFPEKEEVQSMSKYIAAHPDARSRCWKYQPTV